MAHLFRFIFVLCAVICTVVSCSLQQRQDVKIVKPLVDVASICTNKSIIFARSRKLICLLCKGFDPTCFATSTTTTSPTSTSTTSTTTPASTTSTSSTTTPSTTTSSTTTTSTAAPSETE